METKEEKIVDRYTQKKEANMRAEMVLISLQIVESIKNGESQIKPEYEESAKELYSQKILELLPEEVDALSLFEEKKIYRENLQENKESIVWDKKQIEKYANKLKRHWIWKSRK